MNPGSEASVQNQGVNSTESKNDRVRRVRSNANLNLATGARAEARKAQNNTTSSTVPEGSAIPDREMRARSGRSAQGGNVKPPVPDASVFEDEAEGDETTTKLTDENGETVQPAEVSAEKATEKPAEKAAEKVTEAPAATVPAYKTLMLSRPYIIKTYEWTAAGLVEGESILSQTLDKGVFKDDYKYAGDLTLSALRKLVSGMSYIPRLHKFCTPSGTIVGDDSLAFEDYLALEHENTTTASTPAASTTAANKTPADTTAASTTAANEATETPKAKTIVSTASKTLMLCYRSMTADKVPASANASLPAAFNKTMDPAFNPGVAAASDPGKLKSEIDEKSYQAAANENFISAGQLTEDQWRVVLRNCAVFFGWIVDPKTRSIRRAPRQAFQLRAPKDYDAKDSIPDFSKKELASPASQSKQGTKTGQQAITDSSGTGTSDTNTAGLQKGDTADVSQELPQGSESATTEAAALETTPNGSGQEAQNQAAESTQAQAENGEQDQNDGSALANATKAPKAPPKLTTEKMKARIPNFRVNDDSKIDITVCSESMMESFAKHDFSSQSTEASVSGGFGGITAGVSAGFAKSSSKDSTNETVTQGTTMVARYKYPRCDLFLYAEDLEPTPEFAALLKEIETTKSIHALRKVHRFYGQLFCQEVTLGGRLLSTKIMSSTKVSETAAEKEQFKVSVGVQVNTPYGGASVKHEQEKGSASSEAKSKTSASESNVFEAVGGDTILSSNPPLWCQTVGNPNTWRIIERAGLSSLIEMLAEMPGYQKVQSWFVQAVPALAEFITLDAGHQVTARFRVTSPTNSLSLTNNGDVAYYLGHSSNQPVTPRLNFVNTSSQDTFWFRVEITTEQSKVLFNPSTYRAPVIRGFGQYDVGGAAYGSAYNDDFSQVSWNIVAPFADALINGTRVIMKTAPFRHTDSKEDIAPSHMVIFRNAQGQFVPAMSDRDEYQYWRIIKAPIASPGDHIKAGDAVRLCWSFKDQTTGWRDFKDDVFGRRQFEKPADVASDVLYPKVPWPRFEAKGIPTAMIMSGDEKTEIVTVNMDTLAGKLTYGLQDMTFRIDTVANGETGDANDYLLSGVSQGQDTTTSKLFINGQEIKPAPPPVPPSFVNSIFFFGIF